MGILVSAHPDVKVDICSDEEDTEDSENNKILPPDTENLENNEKSILANSDEKEENETESQNGSQSGEMNSSSSSSLVLEPLTRDDDGITTKYLSQKKRRSKSKSPSRSPKSRRKAKKEKFEENPMFGIWE